MFGVFTYLGRYPLHAAGQGLEPQLTVPETAVLPLDDQAILKEYSINTKYSRVDVTSLSSLK
jgi:hypothetical protein